MKEFIYLCAGLFAEGPTDHKFLLPLLERLLNELGNEAFPARVSVAAPLSIGTLSRPKTKAHEAILHFWDSCTIFVVHTDGTGDREEFYQRYVAPSILAVHQEHPEAIIVPCIPEREIEAWMLADPKVFSYIIKGWAPELPPDPEKVLDPKQAIEKILKTRGQKLGEVYPLFGEMVAFDSLRRLESFQRFEDDLRQALRSLGKQR